MNEEHESLLENNTFNIVKRLDNRVILGTR